MKKIFCIILIILCNSIASVAQIIPDDYPVTDEMFKGNFGLINMGEAYSFDKVWFLNEFLNETLIFELYTDYHRLLIYHFKNCFTQFSCLLPAW